MLRSFQYKNGPCCYMDENQQIQTISPNLLDELSKDPDYGHYIFDNEDTPDLKLANDFMKLYLWNSTRKSMLYSHNYTYFRTNFVFVFYYIIPGYPNIFTSYHNDEINLSTKQETLDSLEQIYDKQTNHKYQNLSLEQLCFLQIIINKLDISTIPKYIRENNTYWLNNIAEPSILTGLARKTITKYNI